MLIAFPWIPAIMQDFGYTEQLQPSRDYNQRVSISCYHKCEITPFASSMIEVEQVLETVETGSLKQGQ